MDRIENSLLKLEKYLENEEFRGYDPYDTLNSWIPFQWAGKWGPVIAIQIQKRNPVNIRPILGIKKEINPKAFGLFLQAYSLLYAKSKKDEYLIKAKYFFEWLSKNQSEGYDGIAWGYNFPWASPEKHLGRNVPSAVVTGFVCKGIVEYYKITQDPLAIELISGAAEFVKKNLPFHRDENGICISYTPIKKDYCFNASLLAAEVLALAGYYTKNQNYINDAIDAVNWAIQLQKEDGRWNYSRNIITGQERVQIDFHQGYILDSIFTIQKSLNISDKKWNIALTKGLNFYMDQQFSPEGRSFWRLPKEFPVEIHNQSQGIITLTRLSEFDGQAFEKAQKIAYWTIDNMQAKDGHFYYQKFRNYSNRLSYMRWSQAWMFLALSYLLTNKKVK